MAGRLATGTLAARGAGNPAALAAFIASRARTGQPVMDFADGNSASPDACPRCGYTRESVSLSNQLDLSTPRYPVASPNDVLVSRTPQGTAAIRHRRGGAMIGEIRQGETGWQAVYEGKDLSPHSHQRGALAELLGTWNKGTGSLSRPAESPGGLQPPAVQTPLMQQYGIPAVRTFAFPNTSSSSGTRTTSSDDSDDDDDNDSGDDTSGLNDKGKAVHKKLRGKGWPHDKAKAFAMRAQNFGGGDK
jgi:hypothetical protein